MKIKHLGKPLTTALTRQNTNAILHTYVFLSLAYMHFKYSSTYYSYICKTHKYYLISYIINIHIH